MTFTSVLWKKVIILPLSVLLVTVCVFGQQKFVTKLQGYWLESLNETTINRGILDYYSPSGAVDYGSGLSKGQMDIYMSLVNLKNQVSEVTAKSIIGRAADGMDNHFEMGLLTSGNKGGEYCYFTAWKSTGGKYAKEYEIISKVSVNSQNIDPGIERARKDWMTYSNLHSPEDLTNKVYTKDAVYFNNGEISEGRGSISRRYSYMENTSWRIELTALFQFRTSELQVFEMGKYVSNGEGLYFLIWEKQPDGSWSAVFDLNF